MSFQPCYRVYRILFMVYSEFRTIIRFCSLIYGTSFLLIMDDGKLYL